MERRNSVRVALGKKEVLLRIPSNYNEFQIQEKKEWVTQWLLKHKNRKPDILNRYIPQVLVDGNIYRVRDTIYTLRIKKSKRGTGAIKVLKDEVLLMTLPDDMSAAQEAEMQKTLLSRIFAKIHYPQVELRVHYWNDKYFSEQIKAIRLKYTTSNWGSCSNSGNINLSTRLLLAPEEVMDYVIVHELSHFKEMNHSARFWNIVAEVMPNYKQKEQWLKTNGHLCDF